MRYISERFRERLWGRGLKPVVLAEVYAKPIGWPFRCVSGEMRLFSHPNVLIGLSPTKTGFDLRDKQWQVGKLTLTFNGNWFRRYIATCITLGSRVRLFAGFEDFSESEFEQHEFYRGLAGDAVPGEGFVTLPVEPAAHLLLEAKLGGQVAVADAVEWASMHPLDARTLLYTRAGIASELVDALSFDPQRTEYADIAHWGVARTGRSMSSAATWFHQELKSPTDAEELDSELARLLPCISAISPEGKIRCIRLSRNAPVVRHILARDVIRADQGGNHKHLVNEATLWLGQKSFYSRADDGLIGVRRKDTNAQDAIQYPGAATGRVVPDEETSPWLHQVAQVLSVSGAGPWTVRVSGVAARLGFAGCCLPTAQRVSGGTVPTAQQLSAAAGRYAYLMLENIFTGTRDFIRATVAAPVWGGSVGVLHDEYGASWPGAVDFTIDTRGLSDSTADLLSGGSASGLWCYDLTIPFGATLETIQWFNTGVPDVELHLNLKHWELEPGDVISFDDDTISITGSTGSEGGVNSDTTWLIADEQRDQLGDEPGLVYTCFWLRTVTQKAPQEPQTTVQTVQLQNRRKSRGRTAVAGSSLLNRVARASDFAASTSVLDATLTAGAVAGGDDASGLSTGITLTMTANRDNYVYRNLLTGMFVVRDVALAAAEPSTEPGDVPLYMFQCNGVTITATTDRRSTAKLNIGDVSGGVASTRQIIAGAGLTGGGNLTADRTLDVAAANSSITVNADSIQVGATIPTALALSNMFALSGVLAPAAIGGATNNYGPAGIGNASILLLTLSADTDLRSIDSTGSINGRHLWLFNYSGGFTLTIPHDLAGTAANRIYTPESATITVMPNGSTLLIYDTSVSRWRVVGGLLARQARQIIAGAGLTGGGDLSADRTLDVVAGNSSISVAANSLQVGATIPTVTTFSAAGAAVVVDNNLKADAIGIGGAPSTAKTLKLTTTATPVAAGEIAMDVSTGRPHVFRGSADRGLIDDGDSEIAMARNFVETDGWMGSLSLTGALAQCFTHGSSASTTGNVTPRSGDDGTCIRVNGTFTVNNTIDADGLGAANGSAGAAGTAGAAVNGNGGNGGQGGANSEGVFYSTAATSSAAGGSGGNPPTNGTNGNVGAANNSGSGGGGGGGGNSVGGGNGGNGGTGRATGATTRGIAACSRIFFAPETQNAANLGSLAAGTGATSGGGGGGGGASATNNGGAGGSGGLGGDGGGFLWIGANAITGTGTIRANGTNGSNGNNGANGGTNAGGGGSGGGGGGGSGGVVVIKTRSGQLGGGLTIQAQGGSGGAGGTPGNGNGVGVNGATGGTGGTGGSGTVHQVLF